MTKKQITITAWEYIKVIGGALILAATVRSLWFEPFKIPSSSMVPTLLIGDFLFVDKNNYGYRNPCSGQRYGGEPPKKGDVIVFEKKKGYLCGLALGMGSLNFIKRVVAVPGDKIAYFNKTLYVNGKSLGTEFIEEYQYHDSKNNLQKADKFTENLGDIQHDILLMNNRPSKNLVPVVVPEGHYVVMGDNRDNSLDSRAWNYPSWGFVKAEDIVGQAKMLFWSWDNNYSPRWERPFSSLVAQSIEK